MVIIPIIIAFNIVKIYILIFDIDIGGFLQSSSGLFVFLYEHHAYLIIGQIIKLNWTAINIDEAVEYV